MAVRSWSMLLLLLSVPPAALAWPTSFPPRTDSAGDPLPAGAIARLGSLRLHHSSPADLVAFSPDGKWLASFSRWEKQLDIWETHGGKLRRQLHLAGVAKMAFAPDGNMLAVILTSGSFTPEILVEGWDLTTGRRMFRFREEERYIAEGVLAFSPDGAQLYFGRSMLYRIDLARRRIDLRLPMGRADQGPEAEAVLALAQSPDRKTLVTAEGDSAVRFRDGQTGAIRCQVQGLKVSSLALCPDGKSLALAIPGAVEIWQMPLTVHQGPGFIPDKRRLPHEGDSPVVALAISADSKRLLSLRGDGSVAIWDVMGKRVSSGKLPAGQHAALNFASPQQPLVLTTDSSSGGLRIWDVAQMRELFPERNLGGQVTCMTFSPDGRILVTGHEDKRLHFWQARTGKPTGQVRLPECPCQADFRADGRRVVAGGNGHWWQVSPGKFFGLTLAPLAETAASSPWQRGRMHRGKPLPWRQHRLDQRTVTPDGYLVDLEASSLQVFEVSTGKQLLQRPGFAAALAPGRNVIAVLQNETDVVLVDLATGTDVDRWEVPREEMVPGQPWLQPRIAFAPNGRTVALGTPRGSVMFRDLAAKTRLQAKAIAPGTVEYRAGIWESADALVPQNILNAQRTPVTLMAFAPDSRILACAYGNGTVLVWNVSTQTLRPPPTDSPPESSWEELLSGELPTAWNAHWALVGSTKTVAFLRQKLRPVQPPDLRPLPHLVRELDSPRFTIRDRATKSIADLGPGAESALREALKRASSLEAERRLQHLLNRMEGIRNRQQQELRAVAVLEQIASDDARRLLKTLAAGEPQAPLTLAAKAARKRMAKGN